MSSFLRETLDLTGTHVGCDTSQCGACVVHVDGVAVKSCTMLAAEADGTDVATIEGQAAPDGTLNIIQQAFQDHHGLQCGFCTPGMVMTTAALLKDNPKPSEQEIRVHLRVIFAAAPDTTTSSRQSMPRPDRTLLHWVLINFKRTGKGEFPSVSVQTSWKGGCPAFDQTSAYD